MRARRSRGEGVELGPASRASRLLLFALIAALASAAVFPFDAQIVAGLRWIDAQALGRSVPLRLLKSFGKTDILAVVLLCLCLTRQRRSGAAGIAALALVVLPVLLLKVAVQRARPEHSGFSFPSGDASSAAAALLPLALALGRRGLALVLLVLAVGAGRVVLFYHYPSDVLAGAALGAGAAWAALRFVPRRRLRPRWRPVAVLLVAALVVSTWIAVQSDGAPPFPAFAATILPCLLAVVAAERLRLARRAALPGAG